MKELRLRVELNKGRVGMPLGKLAAVMEQTVKFLERFSADMQVGETSGKWLAERFENNSVDFDCRLAVPLAAPVQERSRSGLRMVLSGQYAAAETALMISTETRWEFARIAAELDPDEEAHLGLYAPERDEVEEWFTLDARAIRELEDAAAGRGRIFGEVQGIVHSFVKEGRRPYLSLRELSTGNLVKCHFKPEQYQAAVEVLADPEAVVFVEGETAQDAVSGEVVAVEVADFRLAPDFSREQLHAWIGSMPDYTGTRTTDEHLALIRDE